MSASTESEREEASGAIIPDTDLHEIFYNSLTILTSRIFIFHKKIYSMIIREAIPDDNEDLIALTKSVPMDGWISLRIDREPDYFRLLNMRGEGKVLVASIAGRIVGAISVAYRTVYINGRPVRAGYIGDLRVHPRYSGSRITYNLLHSLHAYVKSLAVDIYFIVVAMGNHKVRGLIEGRFDFPKFQSVGTFYVYEILPLPYDMRYSTYEILDAPPTDIYDIHALLNEFNSRFEFGSFLSDSDLEKELSILSSHNDTGFIEAKNNTGIVAAVSLIDTSSFKRNVIITMPAYLRYMISFLNCIGKTIPIPPLPRIGEPVNMLYIRHAAYVKNNPEALQSLFSYVRSYAYRKKYSFVTIGFHERDPRKKMLRFFPKFTFHSEGFATSLRGDEVTLQKIRDGVPHEDFSLV